MSERVLCFLLVLFMVSCQSSHESQRKTRAWMQEDGTIKVLCTTGQVAALAEAVGGKDVSVLELIPSQSDPHTYRLVRGDAEKFQRAALVLYSGLGLEHSAGIMRRISGSNGHAITDAAAKEGYSIMAGAVNDPHMWMDASLWAKGARSIASLFSEIRPDLRQDFEERARKVEKKLLSVHQELQETLQRIPDNKRYLVTVHDAFYYFCRAYLATDEERKFGSWKTRCVAPEGLAPESQISTRDIQESVQYIAQRHITVLFKEAGVNQDSLKKIGFVAQKRGLTVTICPDPLYADTMISEGIEGYVQTLRQNAAVLVSALGVP